jgi:hypothetical protein
MPPIGTPEASSNGRQWRLLVGAKRNRHTSHTIGKLQEASLAVSISARP